MIKQQTVQAMNEKHKMTKRERASDGIRLIALKDEYKASDAGAK